jgi:iron complex outermembrane recepter protein
VPVAEIEAEIDRLQKLLAQTKQANAKAGGTDNGVARGPETKARTEPVSLAPNTTVPAQSTNSTAGLDEVVVTAEKSIKEVPRSIAVVSGAELDTFHVNNFRDILDRVGNVRTSWQKPQTTAIIVRGVGWSAGTGVLDPSVGVTVDGVSYGVTGIAALSNFTDIEDVQVVRGPQGTDGGRQTSVGRIDITTQRPSFTTEANAEVIVGQLNHLTTTAAIGGPISDGPLAYRFSINRETADGAYHNKNDVYNTYRNTDRTNARLQFLLTPNADFKAKLSINFTPTGKEMCENCFNFNTKTPAYYDNVDANGKPVPFNYANDPYGKLQRRWFTQNTNFALDDFYSQNYVDRLSDYPNQYATKGAALNLEAKLSDDLTLSSITAYQDFHYRQGRGSLLPFNTVLAPQGTSNTYWQGSEEVKLNWAVNPTLKSQSGLIFFRRDFSLIGQLTRYGPDADAWYSNAAQYGILDPVNPALPNATSAVGWDLLKNSADGLITDTQSRLNSHSLGVYSNITWEATPKLTVTAGARATREERTASGSSLIEAEGYGPEFDPVGVNNVKLGGFDSDALGNLRADNSAAQLSLADFTAQKYFGAPSYSALTAAQKLQVATTKAIRSARIGALYQQTTAQPYKGTLPAFQLGSTYRLTPSQSVYASWAHGTKAGVSQISGGTPLGGKSVPVGSETSDSFDLGLKSLFLDETLVVDGTLFLQNIRNYIQNGVRYDPVQTALNSNGTIAYLTALVNVPKVQTKGMELSLSYSGIEYTTVRFSGAYTDAVYKSFPQAATPWELQGDPSKIYTDESGHVLPGAPKFSGNTFVAFSYPVGSRLLAHANVNYNFTSGYYSDQSLSRYLWTKSTGVTDINVGLGRSDGRFDVGILLKNAFNADTGVWLADQTPVAFKPGVPRWIGVVFRAAY